MGKSLALPGEVEACQVLPVFVFLLASMTAYNSNRHLEKCGAWRECKTSQLAKSVRILHIKMAFGHTYKSLEGC